MKNNTNQDKNTLNEQNKKETQFVFDIKSNTIKRRLPQYWNPVDDDTDDNNIFDVGNNSITNALVGFSIYLAKMRNGLNDIKNYDKKAFNADNSYTIDEYIDLFQSILSQIDDLLLDKRKLTKYKTRYGKNNDDLDSCYLDGFNYTKLVKKSAFLFDSYNNAYGFTDETYNQLKPLAKKIFMLEKMCSFTTRKFWKKQITKIEDFNINKPFKIVARVIFPENWRTIRGNKNISDYYENKIYSSASLIDEKHKKNLFTANSTRFAILILDFDEKDFVCADLGDSFSEESINGSNPYEDKASYSRVNRVDTENVSNKRHELFSTAVEIVTPKSILKKLKKDYEYSEVNLKNAKVVGVISPNEKSDKFASQQAKTNNVELFKLYNEKDNEEAEIKDILNSFM